MMVTVPKGSTAVMARRVEPPDSLDFFPTPPWATRAGLHYALGITRPTGLCAWDPCCGQGHMALVLAETFGSVHASDVHDYGAIPQRVGSYVGQGPDVIECPAHAPDWIIMNPPFNQAQEFITRALGEASFGVAALVRIGFLEGGGRYRDLFAKNPPALIAQYCDRVPMVRGRWDPEASTATSYCWIVWDGITHPDDTRFKWIPPGSNERFTWPDDVARFATPRAIDDGQTSWI